MEKNININAEIKIKFYGTSSNKKTGNISQTYTTANTCPTRCPFKEHGCYAKSGHTCIHWKKVQEEGCAPEELRKVIDTTPHTNVVRHNVAGDIATPGTSDINADLVNTLCKSYKGMKPYTYTHCTPNEENFEKVRAAAEKGFVINFSTENLEQAKKVRDAGLPAVIAVNTIKAKRVQVGDLIIKQCPATIEGNATNCALCGACWRKNRKEIIAFPVHGAGKNKAKKAGFLKNI